MRSAFFVALLLSSLVQAEESENPINDDLESLPTVQLETMLFDRGDIGVEAATELAIRTNVDGQNIYKDVIYNDMMRSLTHVSNIHRLRAVQYFYLLFFQIKDSKIAMQITDKLERLSKMETDSVVRDAYSNAIAESKQNHNVTLNQIKRDVPKRVNWFMRLAMCALSFRSGPRHGPANN